MINKKNKKNNVQLGGIKLCSYKQLHLQFQVKAFVLGMSAVGAGFSRMFQGIGTGNRAR